MGIFSSILGAVAAPLIGGIFGRKKQKTQTVSNSIDYVKMRKNIEAAGGNFVTALRGGGGAGFTQTHSPVLSSSAYMANTIGQGLSAGIQAAFDYDPLDESKSQIEMEIMQGQLRRINESNDSFTRLGDAPVATGSRYRVTPMVGERSVTNPFPTHSGLEVNPQFIDAEAWETRYGDIAQEIGGAINAGADFYYNRNRPDIHAYRVPLGHGPRLTTTLNSLLTKKAKQPRNYREYISSPVTTANSRINRMHYTLRNNGW